MSNTAQSNQYTDYKSLVRFIADKHNFDYNLFLQDIYQNIELLSKENNT